MRSRNGFALGSRGAGDRLKLRRCWEKSCEQHAWSCGLPGAECRCLGSEGRSWKPRVEEAGGLSDPSARYRHNRGKEKKTCLFLPV